MIIDILNDPERHHAGTDEAAVGGRRLPAPRR
jgi:hypothetical protein